MTLRITYGLIILIVCAMAPSLQAQQPVYRPDNKYVWDDPAPTRSNMDARYADDDAVILNEQNAIKVYKANPMYMSLVFEKRMRIRYNTVDGIDGHAVFVIPESLDPTYDQQELPTNQRGVKLRPQYFDVEVDHFKARSIRPDGTVQEVAVGDSVALDRLKFGIKYHDTWSFVFEVFGLEPGDELDIHYKYSIPYDVNWFRFNSNRVFFHGELPKQHYNLEFRADVRQDLSVENTPAHTTEYRKNLAIHNWTYDHLPGVMTEVNARPHEDLPYLVYGLSQSNLRYRYRHNLSYELLEIPYWTYILKLRENRALWLRRVSKKKIPDKQNIKIEEFMERVELDAGAKTVLQLAEDLHEHIISEFDYITDDAWFENRDMKLQKMGDHVEKEKLRELSRYDLYAKLLYNLELNYHTAYFMDKRTGRIGQDYLSPIWDNEWAFVLFGREGPMFMHPKREDFGGAANELPFYWEGSTALLAQVDLLWSDQEQVPHFIEIPKTQSQANFRNTNVRVGVSLKKQRASFDAKVTLSGQFETMTASAYEYGKIDSTISAEYGRPIYALNGSISVLEKEFTARNDDPPFRSQLRMKYIGKHLIEETENGYSIDLAGILNYAAPDGFNASLRDLPFYWDFLFLDNFNYQLVFDKDIEIQNVSAVNFNINNDLGDLMFRCEQTSSNTIMISSFLQTKVEKVDPEDAQELQELLDAVNGLSELSISVQKVDRSDP